MLKNASLTLAKKIRENITPRGDGNSILHLV